MLWSTELYCAIIIGVCVFSGFGVGGERISDRCGVGWGYDAGSRVGGLMSLWECGSLVVWWSW